MGVLFKAVIWFLFEGFTVSPALPLATSKLVEFGAERRKRDSPAGDAAALDAFARKIAKAVLVDGVAFRLKRDLDRFHEFEGARLGDIESKLWRELTRNEAGKGIDC